MEREHGREEADSCCLDSNPKSVSFIFTISVSLFQK